MNLSLATAAHPRRFVQERLLWLSTAFLFFFCLAYTFAPAVRQHAWFPINWMHWLAFIAWLAGFQLLHLEMERTLPDTDPYLLPVVSLLVGWGLLTIWRLDTVLGERQTIWMAVGLLLLRAGMRRPDFLSWLRNYKYIWLTAALLITALTFLLGTYPGGEGPRLWLGCCGIYFQPSEPLKLLLVIYLAAYLADRLPSSFSLYGLLAPTLLIVGLALGLILAQRDLGTATLFISIYTLMLYLASGRRRMLLLSLAAILLGVLAGYQLYNVVRVRFEAWLDPWADASGHSFQIIQSLMAYAAGGVFGRGPGLGSPSVVPVAHSDFIFAAIGEENGLLGVIGVLVAYLLLVNRGLKIALSAPQRFQRYLAAGVSSYFAVQTVLIAGGTLRLLPLTGVTLPFMSYGGSSLVTSLAALLILLFANREPEEEPAPLLRSLPYLVFGGVFLSGLLAIGSLAAWWTLFRADELLNRTDNPRISIADRFVPRGSILDRNNHPLVVTSGIPGEYQRSYLYPNLAPVTGYLNPLYGKAGLEDSLGNYLRGLKGTPSSQVWWSSLVYSQPPEGLDVRTSIDIDLQNQADALLGDHKGSVVMLNAKTGEILVMASHPGYDPNHLADHWNELITSPNAPLINRATQGLYPPGPALGPFLMTAIVERTSLPQIPDALTFKQEQGKEINCSLPPGASPSWGEAVRDGCPAPLVLLSKQFRLSQMEDLFQTLGFGNAPKVPLPVSSPSLTLNGTEFVAIGLDGVKISPLQMALAASAFSADGMIPDPILALAVDTPNQGWVALPGGEAHNAFKSTAASFSANSLAEPGSFFWSSTGLVNGSSNPVTWFLAGTLSRWKGSPLVVVVALEENNPALAAQIGSGVISTALK